MKKIIKNLNKIHFFTKKKIINKNTSNLNIHYITKKYMVNNERGTKEFYFKLPIKLNSK